MHWLTRTEFQVQHVAEEEYIFCPNVEISIGRNGSEDKDQLSYFTTLTYYVKCSNLTPVCQYLSQDHPHLTFSQQWAKYSPNQPGHQDSECPRPAARCLPTQRQVWTPPAAAQSHTPLTGVQQPCRSNAGFRCPRTWCTCPWNCVEKAMYYQCQLDIWKWIDKVIQWHPGKWIDKAIYFQFQRKISIRGYINKEMLKPWNADTICSRKISRRFWINICNRKLCLSFTSPTYSGRQGIVCPGDSKSDVSGRKDIGSQLSQERCQW